MRSSAYDKYFDKVYRNELKYYINFHDYEYLARTFKQLMHIDSHANDKNEYFIRSLYFDSIINGDYYDKIIGVQDRKKIRLRIYDCYQDKVKLEIKNKYSQYMLKETSTITREECIKLIHGDVSILLEKDDDVLTKAYYYMIKDYYQPAVVVDYEREAYTYDIQNIRITFDKNIRSSITDFDIFNPHINMVSVFDEPTMVLEVKYNRLLPGWIKETLSRVNSNSSSISKYCKGRLLF